MVRRLVLIVVASAVLAVVLASVCHQFFPDVLPYGAGEDELPASWRHETAAMIVAGAWASLEVSRLFAIVPTAYLGTNEALKAQS